MFSFLARLALEQSVRTLSDMNGIGRQKVKQMGADLAYKKNIFPQYVNEELQAKYGKLSEVTHGNQVPDSEVDDAIAWVDKFITKYLSR